MKNLSISKAFIWAAVLAFIITFWLSVGSLFAQTTWTNVGTTLQQKVVGSDTLYRIIKSNSTYGAPFKISDSLNKRVMKVPGKGLSTNDYTSPEKAKVALINDGTSTLSNNIGGNANTATLASSVTDGVYTVGNQSIGGIKTFSSNVVSPSVPTAGNHLTNKTYVDAAVSGVPIGDYQLKSEKGNANGYASLDGTGKVPLSQINDALIGSVNYRGTYDVVTNTPTLPTAATENKGWYYLVSNDKTVFEGDSVYAGDWVISNGSVWGTVRNNRPETDPVYKAEKSTLALANGSNATGTWPISVTGNAATATTAANSTRWNTFELDNATSGTINGYMLGYGSDGKVHFNVKSDIQPFLDVNNGATLNNSISGNAATVTSWGSNQADFTSYGTDLAAITGFDTPTGKQKPFTLAQLGTALNITSGGETLPSVAARNNVSTSDLMINKASPSFRLQNSGVDKAFFALATANDQYANGTLVNDALLRTDGGRFGISTNSGTDFGFMQLANGNVGIGTTTPGEKLEVQNGTSAAKIRISNSIGGFTSLGITSSASSNSTLDFSNNLLLTGGNVGLGTSTPSAKLDVNGTGKFAGDVTAPNFIGNLNGSAAQWNAVNLGGNVASPIRLLTLDAGGTNSGYSTMAQVGTALGLSNYAPLASPALTGTPTAPTATAGTNTTQIATTAFVQNAVNSLSVSAGTYTPTITNGSNAASSMVIGVSHYTRTGNQVTVFGSLQVTPTAGVSAGTNTLLSISLPLLSDFTDGQDLSGHGSAIYNNGGNNVAYSSYLGANPASDLAAFSVMAYTTNAINVNYSFMYTVK